MTWKKSENPIDVTVTRIALKIVVISDTHNSHNSLTIPECDILIHAGDESYRGTECEIRNFAKWFDKQNAKHLVWIPGNHSLGFEANYPLSLDWIKSESSRTNVLLNSNVIVEGIRIHGSPVTPWFHDWSYNVIRGLAIKKYWDMIPVDTSIVVTHGPPFGILDKLSRNGANVGCKDLMDAMLRVKPKVHCFGHIHEGYGRQQFGDTLYLNASIMDEHYDPVNLPHEFEL